MVVVEGAECPTPCKREGKLSDVPGDMSRGNVWIPTADQKSCCIWLSAYPSSGWLFLACHPCATVTVDTPCGVVIAATLVATIATIVATVAPLPL